MGKRRFGTIVDTIFSIMAGGSSGPVTFVSGVVAVISTYLVWITSTGNSATGWNRQRSRDRATCPGARVIGV